MSYFFEDPASIKCSPTTGGVNNVVQYAETPAGERYILRIYNNGNDSARVSTEINIEYLCNAWETMPTGWYGYSI